MAEATHLLGLPVKHKPGDIKPQGAGSGLDADKVDGKHANDLGHQALTANGTTDASTTSTNFVDMPDMSITITTGANPILILFSAACELIKAATGYTYGYFRLKIDSDNYNIGAYGQEADRTHNFAVVLSKLITLSAGEHTIKVQWKARSGNTLRNWANLGSVHRSLTVLELKN